MSVYFCVGDYATTPYTISGLEINVYSMEELCFCILENAFLLDMTFMNDGLADWIDKSLHLPELSKMLYPVIHKKGSLSQFVTTIMEYTGLYGQEQIEQVSQILKQGTGLSGIEKKKTRTDRLLSKKRYVAALRGYDGILKLWEEMEKENKDLPAGSVRAAVLHNKGVALTGLMLYEPAAECFYQSYLITNDKEELTTHLAAKRLQLGEGEYLSYVAEKPDTYEVTLALEKKMELLESQFAIETQGMLSALEIETSRDDNVALKEKERERLTLKYKNEYRECVSG